MEESHDSLIGIRFDETDLMSIFTFGCSVAMVIGGVIPYIPQYLVIKRNQNVEGFSTYVCLALLVANTLRILFWFGRPFETPLLLQSIIMNISMMIMMQLCIKVKKKTLIIPAKVKTFTDTNDELSSGKNNSLLNKPQHHKRTSFTFMDFDMEAFWDWSDFLSYVEFMATFTVIVGVIVYLFIDYPIIVETIGFLAVFTEAALGAPQLYKNYQNKSTEGMSKKMVLMWTSGDTFKTVYFILRDAPKQFWICGLLQISIDIAILLQVVFYRSNISASSSKSQLFIK